MAGSSLFSRLFPGPTPDSLLDKILPQEGEAPSRTFGSPRVRTEEGDNLSRALGIEPSDTSYEDRAQDSTVRALEEAPRPPGPGASRIDALNFRIAREEFLRGERNIVRETERQRVAAEASDRETERQQALNAATAAQRLAGGGATFAQMGQEQDAADRADPQYQNGDTLRERIGKMWAQNWAGFEQQLAGLSRFGAEHITDAVLLPLSPGSVLPGGAGDIVRPVGAAAMHPVVEASEQLHRDAQADIEANEYRFHGKGDYYAQNIADSLVQMVPTVVAAYFSGGASVEAELGAAAEGQGGNVIRRFLSRYGQSLKDNQQGLTVLGAQQGGQKYGESRASGRSVEESEMDAIVFGLAEAVPEGMELNILMKPGGRFLPRLLKSAGMEGASEVVTQAIETGYQAGVLKQDMTWGEAVQSMVDAGIIGFGMGAGLGAASHGFHKLRKGGRPGPSDDTTQPAPAGPVPPAGNPMEEALRALGDNETADLITSHAPTAPGIIESARHEAAAPNPADESSPLPTELIQAGRSEMASATLSQAANDILGSKDLPPVNSRVSVRMPNGTALVGTLEDLTNSGQGHGIRVRLDNGRVYEEHLDDIADAGVTIRPLQDELVSVDIPPEPQAGRREPYRIEAATTVSAAAARDQLKARIGRAESPSDTAKNPNSSAEGRYQFVNDTWLRYYRQVFGNTGESREQILAKKSDGAVQERLMDALIADNERALHKGGLDANATNLYLAHFLGSGGAVRALTHPEASIEEIAGEKVVKANPFLKGMTGADVARWAAGRIGSPGTGTGSIPNADGSTEDTGFNFLSDPLTPDSPSSAKIPFEQSSRQLPDLAAQPAASAPPQPSAVTITPSRSGKGIVLSNLADADKQALRSILPTNVQLIPNNRGEVVLAAKHEEPVRLALAPKREVGSNSAGGTVFEDERGVRSVVYPPADSHQGARFSEAVGKSRTGTLKIDVARRDPQYLTLEEEAKRHDVRPSSLQQLRRDGSEGGVKKWVDDAAELGERDLRAREALKLYPSLPGIAPSSASLATGRSSSRAVALEPGRDLTPSSFATVKVGNSAFPFTSFPDVSEKYRQTIDKMDVGVSETPSAKIFDPAGKHVATVAYNGRVFAVDDRGESKGPPLYDPLQPTADQRREALASEPMPTRTPLPDLTDSYSRASPIRENVAITAAGRELPVRYAVVEASSLVTSNTSEGGINPAFPSELQPRDRSRGTSQTQIANIASNLDPRLLGPSPKASDGAPVVDPSGVVLSGNGRTLAIQRAYEAGGDQAQSYRDYLKGQGLNIDGMSQPVLVRVGGESLSRGDVEAFTREANQRDTLAFSSTEQASSDARQLPDTMLDLYRGGDVDAAGNRDFVRSFIGRVVGTNEQAGMISPDGSMSQGAIARIRAALLSKAYDNERLVGQMTEATDTNIKAIGGALTDVSAQWARMRAAAADGRIDPDMDATRFLNEAVGIVERARREGRAVSDFVSQRDIFSGTTVPAETEAFLRLMFANTNFTKPTGRERLADALRYYVDQAMLSAPSGGLFGDGERATPLKIAALAKDRQNGARPEQSDLLRAAGDASEGARRGQPATGGERSRPEGADVPEPDGGEAGKPARHPEYGHLPDYVEAPAGEEYSAGLLATRLFQRGFDKTQAGRAADYAWSIGHQNQDTGGNGKATPGKVHIRINKSGKTYTFDQEQLAADAADLSTSEDPRLTPNEEAALKYVLGRWGANSRNAIRAREILARGKTSTQADEETLTTALRVRDNLERARGKPAEPAPVDIDRLKRDAREAQVSGRGEASSDSEDMDRLMSRAVAAQGQIAAFLNLSVKNVPGVEQVNPGHKSRLRITEKVRLEGYGSADELKDIARAGFIVDSPKAAEEVAGLIKEAFARKGVEDKGWRTLDNGYFDWKIIVTTENGIRAELQIVPRPIWEARKAGIGKIYKRWRTLPAGPEANRLLAEMKGSYAAALEGTEFARLSSASRSASGKASAAASRESGTPSLFESPGAERQSSPAATQAEPPAPRAETPTNRPSISNNSSATGDTSATDIGPAEGRGKPTPNRVFTDDAAERARALLRDKLKNQLNSGIDPEIVQAGITLAGYHIERGARSFAAYARAMIDDLGEAVRPYLRGWYEAIRHYPGLDEAAREMSGPEEIGAALAALDRPAVTPEPARATEGPQETSGGVQGTLFAGDVRAGPRDAERAATDRGAERPSAEEERGSSPPVRPARGADGQAAERSGPRSGGAPVDRGAGSLDFDRVPEPAPAAGDGRRADTAAESSDSVATENWRIEPGGLDEGRGPAQKARDNLRAVEIVKELDASGRPATVEEQRALAKYVGWGGLKNAFSETDGTFPKAFEEIGPRLKGLLTEAEYDTARRSIQYAHYTSEKVVRPMWEAAARLGFKGGKVFEPGMGTGNFVGMMPPDLAAKTQYSGLEFDYITARIAQLLYPKSGIQHADYTRTPAPKNAFDLVVGNPPFSQTIIRSDPEYGKLGLVLHDYFFAKSLDAVRPGGLLMFVTSAGTLNKLGTEARDWLGERADLVGAVRLPGDAFSENAGTKVTTDIVILRKKNARDKPSDIPWAADRSWLTTTTRELPMKDGTLKKGAVNSYFDTRPEMVLGDEGFFDTLIPGGERYAVRAKPGTDLSAALARALATLPADVMSLPDTLANQDGTEFGGREKKDGSYYLAPDGRLMQQRGAVGVPVEGRGKGVKGGASAADQVKIKALIPIRDALRAVYDHDLNDRKTEGDVARERLNAAYDAFVRTHGPINKAEFSYRRPTVIQAESARNVAREELRLAGGFFDEGSFDPSELIARKARTAEIAAARRQAKEAAAALGREWDEGSFDPADMPDIVIVKRPNIDPFMDDQESYRLRAIEHYNDETGAAKKGAVFFENIISKERPPQINSPNDALLYTLNKLGRPDIQEIAFRAGLSRSQVLDELADAIFKVPDQGETYQTRELYLSGNVRAKLVTARAAAERDPEFARNVKALEDVQPAPLGPADIAANLGMPWVPPEIIEEFGRSLGLTKFTARYRGKLAQWAVDGDRTSAASRSEWGTSDRDAVSLIGDALNRQDPKIYQQIRDPVSGSKREVLDPEATQAAQDKVRAIRDRFSKWVWDDTARADKLAALYNRDFNNLVAPVYDGAYLTTPGIASTWRWRPHQRRVIARIIQSGNAYMAHGVGAGKTSAMIGSGMEMRRLGLVKKPMYVVPNHMLGQFTKEFYEQYPTAKIMVADERQFHTDRRKQFVANMAAEDLDAVIITHSAFGYIPISDAFSDQLIQQQLDDYRDILDELKAETKAGDGRGDRFTQRRIEQTIESLQQRLSGRLGRKDQVFNFEETGVDFLFVDEAHLFRKLDFATKMGSVRGIDPQGSQGSYDLFAKTRFLEGRSPGRSHVLASGTPITNTMAELFTLSRYLQPPSWQSAACLRSMPGPARSARTVSELEQDAAGGYKPQTRFAKFVNVAELSAMVRQIMDVVTSASSNNM
jgi:N12 class adenine-specific DNA methylase